MSRKRYFLAATLCALTAIGTVVAATNPSKQQIAHGRQLYIADGCHQCHGYSGQGSTGPRLAPGLIPLDLFSRQLRKPRDRMPIYTSKVLSDADLGDIYAYLGSMPQPKPVSQIPLINQ